MESIKQEIQKAGMREDYIAGKMKISPQYLNMVINGKRKPKNLPEIIRKIKIIIRKSD